MNGPACLGGSTTGHPRVIFRVQLNVVLLALRTQMMDLRISSELYVKVLNEPMKTLVRKWEIT